MALARALVLLLASALAATSDDVHSSWGPKPQLPSQFSVPFEYSPGLVGSFYQDQSRRRSAFEFSEDQLPGHLSKCSSAGLVQNWSFISNATSTYGTVNRVCRRQEGQYTDYFGWVSGPNSLFVGNATGQSLHGQRVPCSVWCLQTPSPYSSSPLSSSQCSGATLERLCGRAQKASRGDCFSCCGSHQRQLQQAGCAQADFDAFCAGGAPAQPSKSKCALEICLDASSRPVQLELGGKQTWRFDPDGFVPGLAPEHKFTKGPYCDKPEPPCPNGAVQTIDAVLFHPRGKYNLAGQDVGDLLGDTFFLCATGSSASSGGKQYSVVSRWTLRVWSGFGEYSLCNGYPPVCMGEETFLVGREAATGWKDRCGQCADNSKDVGSWFSLSAAGECLDEQEPDGKSCSWKAVEKVKTVDVKCPAFAHMFETCEAESSLPLTASAKVLTQIFASDEPANGGCPPVADAATDDYTSKFDPLLRGFVSYGQNELQ